MLTEEEEEEERNHTDATQSRRLRLCKDDFFNHRFIYLNIRQKVGLIPNSANALSLRDAFTKQQPERIGNSRGNHTYLAKLTAIYLCGSPAHGTEERVSFVVQLPNSNVNHLLWKIWKELVDI